MTFEIFHNEYTFATLTEEELLANPYDQFKRWLDEADKLSIAEHNAFSLATSDLQGCPSLRTLLLIEIKEDGLVFYSSSKSKKGQHLQQNPQAEMLFFWREMNRQIRIKGKVKILPRKEADAYFQSRPLGSQQAAVASEQSQPIASRQQLDKKLEQIEKENPNRVKTPETWTGYQLVPHYWEFWQGRTKRFHDRLCYDETNQQTGWNIQRIQP